MVILDNNEILRELVIKVQNGDKESFWLVYDIMLWPLYNFVFYKVSNKELAEDITEEVFIRAWEKIGTYKIESGIPFSSWIYKIASNLIIDYYRKFKYETFLDPEFDIEDEQSVRALKESTENIYNQKLLSHALTKLSEDQKDVIIFKYVNDLEYSDIAIILWKPEWTIRQLHSRALQKLKSLLDGIID